MKLQEIMRSSHGIELSDEQEKMLMKNLDLVLEKNKVMNLTRIADVDDGIVKHLEDSVAVLPYLLQAPEGRYVDLGTGGGFPGIPLALCSGRKTLLVDSVKKKIDAIQGIVDELGIQKQVTCASMRIEDLGAKERGKFAVATARALTSLNSLVELASPLLKEGGVLLSYKARLQQDELQKARDIEELVAVRFREKIDYTLSNGDQRCLVIFEKKGKPAMKLPRRVGLAQHQPLVPRR